MLISETNEIDGWQVVEYSDWIISGNSLTSIDEAKKDLIINAQLIKANALINVEYSTSIDTKQSKHKGGVIHQFKGRAVTLAKIGKKDDGSLDKLLGLNKRAEAIKAGCPKLLIFSLS